MPLYTFVFSSADSDHELYSVFMFISEVWTKKLVHTPVGFYGRFFTIKTSAATQLVMDSTVANILDDPSPIIGN